MTTSEPRLPGCTGKRRYDVRSHAMKTLKRRRSQEAGAPGLEVYRCQFCGDWHLGHTPPTMADRVAARKKARAAVRDLLARNREGGAA